MEKKKKIEKKDWMLIATTVIAIGSLAWGAIETQLTKYGVIEKVVNVVTPGLPKSALTKPPLAIYKVPPLLVNKEPVLVPPHPSIYMPVPPSHKEYHRLQQTGIALE